MIEAGIAKAWRINVPTDNLLVPQQMKRATIIAFKTHLIFECPFCGQSLVRCSHTKAKAVLDPHGGKGLATCRKCGETCLLTLNDISLDKSNVGPETNPPTSPE